MLSSTYDTVLLNDQLSMTTRMQLVVISAIVLFTAIVVVVVSMKFSRPEINSFWDMLRNPGSRPDYSKLEENIEKRAAELADSPREIEKLVDYFVFDASSARDAWVEKRVIVKLGDKVYPRTIEILKDKSNHARLSILTEHQMALAEAPICRLCAIFEQDALPPLETASLLATFLSSESSEIRRYIALAIGSFGSAEALPYLEKALSDEHDYVRGYALMGIERAISADRISIKHKEAYYNLVAGVWPNDTSFEVSDKVPHIMLQLRPNSAIERLSQPDLLTSSFDPAWRILEAFSYQKVVIPRRHLLELIKEASIEPIEYPKDNLIEWALTLLGMHRNKEDLALLEQMLEHTNEDISKGAIEGLYAYHNYSELVRDPWDVIQAEGWEALTDAEKHIYAIKELDAEVNNGGFAQYYFNSYGDHWMEAQSGLKEIGANEHYNIVTATIELFGKTPPSQNQKTRNSQLASLVKKQEDPFSKQDSAWYKSGENESLEKLIFRYDISNLEGRNK